jgi:hypothetical protein
MMLKSAIVMLATVLIVAGPVARAQSVSEGTKPAPAAGKRANPCNDDVQKFCKDVKPGAGRLHQCLGQHEAELSAACRDARQQAKARVERFQQACQADVQKYCKDVKPGGGRTAKCLTRHEAELSAACKTELQSAKGAAGPSVEQ